MFLEILNKISELKNYKATNTVRGVESLELTTAADRHKSPLLSLCPFSNNTLCSIAVTQHTRIEKHRRKILK